ncbi:MAG: hypothetical protein MJY50_01010 [Bacteroidales bacterium]|nr:hypothetical protein [Bacteroidales bacterium]
MNIAVLTSGGKVIVRPDTTRVKDGEDAYMPEFVKALEWTPVLYTRICKSGRSVSDGFAARYFDNFGFGALLYPSELLYDCSEESFACASCLDHTSIINLDGLSSKEAIRPDSQMTVDINGESRNFIIPDAGAVLTRAIVQVTRYCWLRVGDVVAVELSPRYGLRTSGQKDSPVIQISAEGRILSQTKIII